MTRALRTSLAAALCLLAAPAAAGAATPSTAPEETETVRLSNERSQTRVAMAELMVKIRSRPDPDAPQGARLRATTEHGAPEVYLTLEETTGADGDRWVKIRIPKRPNGQTGWVRREALGRYRLLTTALVVDRRALRITLFRDGRRAMRFPIGVGKSRTPTPGGRFWIREKLTYKPDPLYGSRALGTSAYAPKLEDWPLGGVIGIHGTGQPELIPGRPSNGCIRMKNGDIGRLYRAVPVGTPVHII